MKWLLDLLAERQPKEEEKPQSAEEMAKELWATFESRFATLEDMRAILAHVQTQREQMLEMFSRFIHVDLRLAQMAGTVERFGTYLKALQIEFIETEDGGLVMKVPYRYTKITAKGAIERCN